MGAGAKREVRFRPVRLEPIDSSAPRRVRSGREIDVTKPITLAAYGEYTKKSGFYDKNPGRDMPVRQLTLNTPTANSKGLRFGNFVQGRTVIEEELENVFSGKKDAKAALDDAVKRGNEILRQFEAANK